MSEQIEWYVQNGQYRGNVRFVTYTLDQEEDGTWTRNAEYRCGCKQTSIPTLEEAKENAQEHYDVNFAHLCEIKAPFGKTLLMPRNWRGSH